MSNNLESKVIQNESKYGNDKKHEPWIDINFFFPIATKLVDPLYNMGFTPNMITILSTIFTFLSIYFLHLDKRIHAFLSYIFGYILDCVDGKMARKYSKESDFGMVLDSTSDTISNICLLAYLIYTRSFNTKFIIQLSSILLFTYLQIICYGLNEAIISYKESGSDNFYERRKKQLEGKGCGIKYILNELFISMNKMSYQTYRSMFKTYDEDKIYSKLKILKIFGPGNLILYSAILLLYI